MWLLFVIYMLPNTPEEWVQLHPQFPYVTQEECQDAAEQLAAKSVMKYPALAKYKAYTCTKEEV
jgi:hypothetical protein